MVLRNTSSDNSNRLKTSNTHSTVVSNRFFLGIVAFSVSFGLSLVPNWDFTKAFLTGSITVISSYAAAFCVDKRRKNHEMLVLISQQKRIRELEGLKLRLFREINKIEEHHSLLYAESKQLQNQVSECRNQRDNLHRELSSFAGQKKQLETEITTLKIEIDNLDKNKVELNNALSNLTAEKRRLELNYNISRSESNQLQAQIRDLQQEKQDIESNLTLLGRLKPQIEEKLYELRIQLQELEIEVAQKNKLLVDTINQRENIEYSLNFFQTQILEKQTELHQIQEQVVLLQEERDLLQNQVWDLLQQMETLSPDSLPEEQEDVLELFPFSELLEPLEIIDTKADATEKLPQEWSNFMEQLPSYEIQVLKSILEQENPNSAIKKIAEANITMPNLLIDSINERAHSILGELIINPDAETPEIYHEHTSNVKKMIEIHENHISN
ncbi:MAG: hypothetical protein KME32_09995 [Mojavia pulchra JT2-VF2]|jgi:chromosome segregation ATPase|uniref:TerB-C domain-containing protein n=1 Tax=Mojavia pulchra JT2-VF2 TaxID=287848 RepID=A0A951UGW2_9NOST|nr:hypothetical protein [Mojavia pulchra JT2-VF2]